MALIEAKDFETYEALCDQNLSCFEPEAKGHQVIGLRFHEYYFNLEKKMYGGNHTIVDPHVRLLGDESNPSAAVVTYVRLMQQGSDTSRFEETRVWEKVENKHGWMHVHFHRSIPR